MRYLSNHCLCLSSRLEILLIKKRRIRTIVSKGKKYHSYPSSEVELSLLKK